MNSKLFKILKHLSVIQAKQYQKEENIYRQYPSPIIFKDNIHHQWIDDDDDKLILRNGCPTKGVKPYFQLGLQSAQFDR